MRPVAVDIGVALVPQSICEGSGDDLVVRPLAEPPIVDIVAKARPDNGNPVPMRFLALEAA